MQLKCKKKICVVYGEGAVTNQMCQKQFAKFHAGDLSPDHAPWWGRPIEVHRDQIQTLRTISIIPPWRLPTYSKYPNQKVIGEMKNVSFVLLKKKLSKHFGQPNVKKIFQVKSMSNKTLIYTLYQCANSCLNLQKRLECQAGKCYMYSLLGNEYYFS